MKKIICLLLTVCMLTSVCAFGVSAALTPGDVASGFDYNGDGDVNVLDAREVLRISSGIKAPVEGKNYDLDGDGYITYNDVKKVLYVAAGIDVEIVENQEYSLGLFKTELNNIKDVRPGFTKESTVHCTSMKVTTTNAPSQFPGLNVTDVEFSKYVEILEDEVGLLGAIGSVGDMIDEMKAQATELYKPQVSDKTVAARSTSHYTEFPVNKLGYSCYLTIDDIASIRSYEDGDYFYREVTMNTDTYIGDEYPTGTAGFKDRWQTISYGKVFNIPELSESDGSVVNSVTFKDGKIVSKIDKLTGMPVEIDYKFTYIADVSAPVEVDDKGNEGIKMKTKATITTTEKYIINPVEVN